MLTMHALERFFEKVLHSNVDKQYLIDNFYHCSQLVKGSLEKAELLYEGNLNSDENNGIKNYIHDNIIFIME